MRTSIFRSMTLFALLLGLFTPVTQAQAAQAKNLQVQGTSPIHAINPDGTLNLKQDFNGALDLTGWQITLDPQRGPILANQASSTWQSLNNGTNGSIYAAAISNGLVYIAGSFNQICGNVTCNSGNITTYNLAVWNGVNWQTLGGYGVNGGLYTVAVSGTKVYIGGIFSRICADQLCNTGTSIKNIAYWDGSTWSGLGNGLDNFVFTIAVSGNTVYAGGDFNYACGNSACNSGNITTNYIAKWDGIGWSAVGYGLTDAVYALAINGSDLYIGGNFVQLCGNAACNGGNLSVNHVAKWASATSTWYALGNGLDAPVRSVALGGSNVYWGGLFTQACGNVTCNSGNVVVNYIARWNGTTWFALGHGVDGAVSAILVNGSNVYLGGGFSQACGNASCNSGNTLAIHITAWNGSSWSMPLNGVNGYVYAIVTNSTSIYTAGTFAQTCGNAACNSGNVTANNIAKFSIPFTQIIASTGAQDGWILESTETSSVGGALYSTGLALNVGDSAAKQQYVSILSFNTGALPDNATLTGVTLKLKKNGFIGGTNQIALFQGFMVDIKTGFFGTFPTLQALDFQAAADKTLGPASPILTGSFYNFGLINGISYINKLSSNGGLTQIRLRFKLDDNNDSVANYLSLYSGDAATAADRPQLVITYTLP